MILNPCFPFVWVTAMLSIMVKIHHVQALHSTDTITSAGDNTRSGYQINHNMDPTVVGSPQFGIIWRRKLMGKYRGWVEQIYAQALVYTPDDKQFVYVASQQNNVYKIDAITGEIIIWRNLHIPFLVSDLDGCNDISFTIGSTATGVIDPETNTWYFTMKTYRDQTEEEKGRLNGRYFVHALDTRTLQEKPNFPISLEGLIARNNYRRMFQSGNAHQRPALIQMGNYVYAGFASHCVQYNFTGWIIGWHRTTGQIVEAFATEGGPEDKKGGGVWMSGGGIASLGASSMFFATGNGYASQLHDIPVPGRQPPTALEEAVVHATVQPDGTLKIIDFFMPWEKEALDGADKDLGTSGIALLDPNIFTTPTVKRMGCIAGKSGKLYFLNLDNLGGYQMGLGKKDAVLATFQLKNSVFATAGSYPGTSTEGAYVYVNVVQHETVVFKFSMSTSGDPIFTQVAESNEKSAYILGIGHGTSTSFNGQPSTGLYWVTDIQGLNLRVYKTVPENEKLTLIKGIDVPGQVKFSRPTFGNGRVYLTTTDGNLVMIGSPVNPPLLCSNLVEFGEVTIGDATGIVKSLSCQANIGVTVNLITARMVQHFSVVNLPSLPVTLSKGQNITFKVKFSPIAPGPLSDGIYVNTTNSVVNYASNTVIAVRGVGRSLSPILSVSPNTVSFPGIIAAENTLGSNRSFEVTNEGDTTLNIIDCSISLVSENGPWLEGNPTEAGPFVFYDFPTTIPPRSSTIVTVNFNPISPGNSGAYILFKTDGGNKFVTIVATATSQPKTSIDFEAADGSDNWVQFVKDDSNFSFSFGKVYQQTTKNLRLRLTNVGGPQSGILDVTVSKPPIGRDSIVGARNGIDLGEGTQLFPGESQTAVLFCSVPKSQINVDSYFGEAIWTINTGDPTMSKQQIRFTCEAVTKQSGPLYPNETARYRYLGCFKDINPGRQLQTILYGSDTMTNENCIQGCFSHPNNYIYAGTVYRRECWCGNKIPIQKSEEENCNFDCTGDSKEVCGGKGYYGGGSYISLFGDAQRSDNPTSTATSVSSGQPVKPTPTYNPGNSVHKFIGCYREPIAGARALSTLWVSDGMTVSACLEKCASYQYAGLEYSRECWCGNNLSPNSALVGLAECTNLCANNTLEYCGAGNRLSLYLKMPSNSTPISTVLAITTPLADPPPVNTPTVVPSIHPGNYNFTYFGCYTEATPTKALSLKFFSSNSMTVPMCLEFCNSYNYAGLESSTECWCGNVFETGSIVASSQDQCNSLSVYENRYTGLS